ncbi:hypothetical protein TNCV_2513211 [Trichonephila clavipes]|nr:hypothetical protein TNCV_2513211 [Trichonephila clavipes]
MDELNLEQALQDINKEEFQLVRERLQAFVAATDAGCKKEFISYTRAFGDRPHNFEPWSSDEDDTRAGGFTSAARDTFDVPT